MSVAVLQRDYVRAARLGFESLELCGDDAERYRILGDLALTMSNLGLYSQARTIAERVVDQAPELIIRWAAHLNLMGVAMRIGDRFLFDRSARILSSVPFTPFLVACYKVTLGEGLIAFGDEQAGSELLRTGRTMATEYGLHFLSAYADRVLGNVRRPQPSVTPEGAMEALSDVLVAIESLSQS